MNDAQSNQDHGRVFLGGCKDYLLRMDSLAIFMGDDVGLRANKSMPSQLAVVTSSQTRFFFWGYTQHFFPNGGHIVYQAYYKYFKYQAPVMFVGLNTYEPHWHSPQTHPFTESGPRQGTQSRGHRCEAQQTSDATQVPRPGEILRGPQDLGDFFI